MAGIMERRCHSSCGIHGTSWGCTRQLPSADLHFAPKFANIKQYYLDRWKYSTTRTFIFGRSVRADTTDFVLNGMILFNALRFTIPFGLMSGWDIQYWDDLERALEGWWVWFRIRGEV